MLYLLIFLLNFLNLGLECPHASLQVFNTHVAVRPCALILKQLYVLIVKVGVSLFQFLFVLLLFTDFPLGLEHLLV